MLARGPRPIVMFTNDEDTTHVKDAVAAGVCAYIAGLAPQRIRPILTWPWPAFAHEQALQRRTADAEPNCRTVRPLTAPKACSCNARA